MLTLMAGSFSSFWVAVKTKPQQEKWAAENVARQGFDYYLPLIAQTEKATKKKTKPKPQYLFPRYLFVLTEGRWRCLLGTYGVAGVVMCGQKPSVMPMQLMASFRARENAEGLIVPPKAESPFKFESGDKVRVNAGPFIGYSGIYDRDPQNRINVLLDMLGRSQPIPVDESLLEAV